MILTKRRRDGDPKTENSRSIFDEHHTSRRRHSEIAEWQNEQLLNRSQQRDAEWLSDDQASSIAKTVQGGGHE